MKTPDKKKIYMVQVDLAYGENNKAVYLPYAIGLLVAYAWQDETVRDMYELGRFVFTREHVDQAIESFDNPFLVGFSTYVWNAEYNHCFARILKDRFPNCLIVFGGHNVPPDTSLLEQCDYIDILVHGQGEEAFRSLLVALAHGGDLADIPNISYRDTRGNPRSNDTIAINAPLEDYPSPYLTGLFDDLIEKNKDYAFSAILETSRDCPFGCAFCDWGQLKSKTRRFSMERVLREIDWFADHKICYIWGGDANFGTYKEDAEIARYLVETKTAKGYPQLFNMNYSKTNVDGVFEINRLLHAAKMSRGVPLSFQSLLPEVLDNIHRRNMDLESFSRLIAMYNEAGVPMYSELIIGLPGETYESFCRGIGILFESGQHKTLNVYNYELLCNSSLGSRESIEKFNIETARIPLVRFHCALEEAYIQEYSNIVVSTYSMDRAMWKRSSLFSVSVQCFHNLGLLRCFAIYLYYEHGIKYEDFYKRLQQFMETNPDCVAGRVYAKISRHYDNALAGTGGFYCLNPVFGNIVWPFTETMLLENIYEFEKTFLELEEFLRTFPLSDEMFDDLLAYQKCTIKRPSVTETEVSLKCDLNGYFHRIYVTDYAPPEQRACLVRAKDNNVLDTWTDYARVNIWWGHNENRNIVSDFEVTYL